jgi:hypothetical protein
MPFEFFTSLLQQATTSGSRSTVLTDLRWLILIILFALLGAFKIEAPTWFTILLSAFFGFVCLLYVLAYIHFALRAPDYLRSEKFTLSKLAIEKSAKGDTLTGFLDPTNEQRAQQSITPKEPKDE